MPSFSDKYGGLVISLAVNLYQSIEYFTGPELYDQHTNYFPTGVDPQFIYAVEDEFADGVKHSGFHERRLISKTDARLASGLGASAAAVVATIGAINREKNLGLTKAEIAEKAYQIENRSNFTGRQDAYAATFGGFNAIIFEDDTVEVQPLDRRMIENLLPSLVLIHTGTEREKPIQTGLKELSTNQIQKLHEIKNIARQSLDMLDEGIWPMIGMLLEHSWEIKKESNANVTNSHIDTIYEAALKAGAYGGKLLGSGGGGYMLFVVPPQKRQDFSVTMGLHSDFKYEEVDFELDYNGLSTRIL